MADKFHLEINDINEFLVFVSIIKSQDLEALKELTNKLNSATTQLVEAEKKNQ